PARRRNYACPRWGPHGSRRKQRWPPGMTAPIRASGETMVGAGFGDGTNLGPVTSAACETLIGACGTPPPSFGAGGAQAPLPAREPVMAIPRCEPPLGGGIARIRRYGAGLAGAEAVGEVGLHAVYADAFLAHGVPV